MSILPASWLRSDLADNVDGGGTAYIMHLIQKARFKSVRDAVEKQLVFDVPLRLGGFKLGVHVPEILTQWFVESRDKVSQLVYWYATYAIYAAEYNL